jgi:hypothetical protein
VTSCTLRNGGIELAPCFQSNAELASFLHSHRQAQHVSPRLRCSRFSFFQFTADTQNIRGITNIARVDRLSLEGALAPLLELGREIKFGSVSLHDRKRKRVSARLTPKIYERNSHLKNPSPLFLPFLPSCNSLSRICTSSTDLASSSPVETRSSRQPRAMAERVSRPTNCLWAE